VEQDSIHVYVSSLPCSIVPSLKIIRDFRGTPNQTPQKKAWLSADDERVTMSPTVNTEQQPSLFCVSLVHNVVNNLCLLCVYVCIIAVCPLKQQHNDQCILFNMLYFCKGFFLIILVAVCYKWDCMTIAYQEPRFFEQ